MALYRIRANDTWDKFASIIFHLWFCTSLDSTSALFRNFRAQHYWVSFRTWRESIKYDRNLFHWVGVLHRRWIHREMLSNEFLNFSYNSVDVSGEKYSRKIPSSLENANCSRQPSWQYQPLEKKLSDENSENVLKAVFIHERKQRDLSRMIESI